MDATLSALVALAYVALAVGAYLHDLREARRSVTAAEAAEALAADRWWRASPLTWAFILVTVPVIGILVVALSAGLLLDGTGAYRSLVLALILTASVAWPPLAVLATAWYRRRALVTAVTLLHYRERAGLPAPKPSWWRPELHQGPVPKALMMYSRPMFALYLVLMLAAAGLGALVGVTGLGDEQNAVLSGFILVLSAGTLALVVGLVRGFAVTDEARAARLLDRAVFAEKDRRSAIIDEAIALLPEDAEAAFIVVPKRGDDAR